MADRLIVMTKPNVLNIITCAKCNKISYAFPCQHCGSTEFRKGRTMRVMKPQPPDGAELKHCSCVNEKHFYDFTKASGKQMVFTAKPPYQVGDRLLVAEGYQIDCYEDNYVCGNYLADQTVIFNELTPREWKLLVHRKYPFRPASGRFMYKSLARISMVVTDVSVQRPQDLGWMDIVAEGWPDFVPDYNMDYEAMMKEEARKWWKTLWNSLHKDGWQKNEWCWVYKWKEIEIK